VANKYDLMGWKKLGEITVSVYEDPADKNHQEVSINAPLQDPWLCMKILIQGIAGVINNKDQVERKVVLSNKILPSGRN